MTICCNLNSAEIYAFFWENSFSPEIVVVSNMGNLEGLAEGPGFVTHFGFGQHALHAKSQSPGRKSRAMMQNSALFVLHTSHP